MHGTWGTEMREAMAASGAGTERRTMDAALVLGAKQRSSDVGAQTKGLGPAPQQMTGSHPMCIGGTGGKA